MKKFLFVLMMGALVLPMMAQMTATKSVSYDRNSAPVLTTTPVKAMDWSVRPQADMLRDGAVLYSWDFETDESLDGWMSLDNDGDGYNWGVYEYADGDYYVYSHTGNRALVSQSWISGIGALTPDNWIISPQVNLYGTLSIWAMNASSWYSDVFAVYVCVGEPTNIEDFVKVTDDITPGTTYEELTIDLTQFNGEAGCFAIRHYNSVDMMRVYIDDITILAPPVGMPENVTVNPAATTADVAWDAAEDAVAWNVRYREYEDLGNMYWDFEDEAQMADWTLLDADGDGFNWTYFNMTGVTSGRMTPHQGEGLIASASYDKETSAILYPDNWMISPKVKLDGTLSFWAVGQDPSYAAEVFGVYVSTDMTDWTQIGEDITATGDYTEYTFDLSALRAEEGYFAIRHYNVHDMFWLNIDDVALTYGEPAEWTVVEGVANPYTIEGLNPETEYEVQVQAVGENSVSDWTESTMFTTLVGGDDPTEQCAKPEGGFENGVDFHGVLVTLINNETAEGTELHYNITLNGELIVEDAVYDDAFALTEDGEYYIDFWATAPGMLDSSHGGLIFTIDPTTGLSEVVAGKTVANVRYFNVAGQEMAQPAGMTIVVTTYTDGTTSAAKVVK